MKTLETGCLFVLDGFFNLLHGFESFVALYGVIFYYEYMIQSVIGIIAGVLAFAAFVPYIISIFKGETKPQRTTFAIWSAISLVTLLSYFASGARETIWIAAVYAVLQIYVFTLSFKYGMGGFGGLDFICLGGAIVGIFGWLITDKPAVALYLSIASEFLGYVPVFKKAYAQPETENILSWAIGLVAACLNLLALTTLQPNIALYPVYVVVSDGAVVTLLVISRQRFLKKSTQTKSL